jgi:hypothetical protein
LYPAGICEKACSKFSRSIAVVSTLSGAPKAFVTKPVEDGGIVLQVFHVFVDHE